MFTVLESGVIDPFAGLVLGMDGQKNDAAVLVDEIPSEPIKHQEGGFVRMYIDYAKYSCKLVTPAGVLV